MICWFASRAEFAAATAALDPARRTIEGHLAGLERHRGYCVACDRIVEFEIGRSREWIDLRESFLCRGCGLNGRGRTVLQLLQLTLGEPGGPGHADCVRNCHHGMGRPEPEGE